MITELCKYVVLTFYADGREMMIAITFLYMAQFGVGLHGEGHGYIMMLT